MYAKKNPIRAAFRKFLSRSVKAPATSATASAASGRADLSPFRAGVHGRLGAQKLNDDDDGDFDDDLAFYNSKVANTCTTTGSGSDDPDGSNTASTDNATGNWQPARSVTVTERVDPDVSWSDLPSIKQVEAGRNRTSEGTLFPLLGRNVVRRSGAAAAATGTATANDGPGNSPLTWSQLGVSSDRKMSGPPSGVFELQTGPAPSLADSPVGADGEGDYDASISLTPRASDGSRGRRRPHSHSHSSSFSMLPAVPTPSTSDGVSANGGSSTNTSTTTASGSGVFSVSSAVTVTASASTATSSSSSRNSAGKTMRGRIEALSSLMGRLSARSGRGGATATATAAASRGGPASGEFSLSSNVLKTGRASGTVRGLPRNPSESGRGKSKGAVSGQELIDQLLRESSEEIRAQLGELVIDPSEISVGDVLASGASGEVRKGIFRGQVVAVKILKACGSGREWSALMREFRREVGALMTSGSCPRLLQFLGVCVTETCRTCIVTKFMEGGSLQDMLRKRRQRLPASARSCTNSPDTSPTASPISFKGDNRSMSDRKAPSYIEAIVRETASPPSSPNSNPLPLRVALRIAIDVAEGMMFLHAHGMIHRDLKSANILLDLHGRAVVADFGVARLRTDAGEMTNEVGTYRWMAPEALGATHWPVTHMTDVYSYGVVLWEMVTGEMPFADCTPMQAAVAVAMHGKQLPVPDSCPKQLKGLMEQCWQKNPEYRPEFVDILSVLKKVLVEVEDSDA